MMLLNLIVRKLINYKSVWHCCLGSLNLRKVINYSSIRIFLFDILIDKVNNLISIRICHFFNLIWEHNLCLSWRINSLSLSIFFLLFDNIFIPKIIVLMVFWWVNNSPWVALFDWSLNFMSRFIKSVIQIGLLFECDSACWFLCFCCLLSDLFWFCFLFRFL